VRANAQEEIEKGEGVKRTEDGRREGRKRRREEEKRERERETERTGGGGGRPEEEIAGVI
jgi:hypothetical protein